MDLLRKQTYITPAQDEALKRLAAESHTTEAAMLRRALDDWLHWQGINEDGDPFAEMIGIFEGTGEEGDHDDIYRRLPYTQLR